ncbi:MAG: hypothetical protein A2381_15975 [Bdellovibrionales bacterium RIFOXYB1_FULL_37_110]|nr:MAG: hypothetical protein A2417_07825 [Bdellovibrionales bacterium RIFOXYC1_FULL_37_79]OFZ57112.1 MAG: hypothetical protein A2381_15975 [Bdellovibrionales bacterium RIFOXYB1_FULL_37_110]OFZ65404.1 MAG: hypothetical protein A2577_03895 [Bdellovibrionales bacterium RIFOXYD1_FULL_36_51]
MKSLLGKMEKKIGNMKIGLVLLGGLILVLAASSFLESATNASFVDRLVYDTFWFKFLIGVMVLVIITSLISKIPFKKKYLGFYLIHSSLILILAGALLTSYTGINGEVVLYPRIPTNQIELHNYELVVSSQGGMYSLTPTKSILLPYKAWAWNTSMEIFPQIILKQYLPFHGVRPWFGNESFLSGYFSAFFELEVNGQAGEMVLSNHPQSEVSTRFVFKGIHFTLFPQVMQECFLQQTGYDFFFWDRKAQKCFLPAGSQFKVGVSKLGNRFIEYNHQNQNYTFWPEMSPRPMKEPGVVIEDADIMVISKKVFESNADVLLFDDTLLVWSVSQQRYVITQLSKQWSHVHQMDLKIRIKEQDGGKPIINLPEAIIPRGAHQDQPAVLLQHNDFDHWIWVERPYVFTHLNKTVKISLEKAKAQLPFKIKLQKFEMQPYPESQMPATYQSSVEVDDGFMIDINMNNPLNYKGFRLFQSSYFEVNNGEYASVLTASRDPGRLFKYLGSCLFLFGLVYYYFQKRVS